MSVNTIGHSSPETAEVAKQRIPPATRGQVMLLPCNVMRSPERCMKCSRTKFSSRKPEYFAPIADISAHPKKSRRPTSAATGARSWIHAKHGARSRGRVGCAVRTHWVWRRFARMQTEYWSRPATRRNVRQVVQAEISSRPFCGWQGPPTRGWSPSQRRGQ